MITARGSFTAAGRLNATFGAAPAAPALVLGGVGFDASGNVVMDSNAVAAGSPVLVGIARRNDGAIYATTTTAGTDTFLGGMRISASGQIVVVQADPVLVENGNPFNANGALCIA